VTKQKGTDMTTTATPGQVINALKVGEFAKLGKASVAGSLEARRLVSGAVMLYWRYTHQGKTKREPIGAYDSSAPPKSIAPTAKGFSVAAAFEAAKTMAQTHTINAGAGGYAQIKAQQKATREKAQKDSEALKARTLAALMGEYAGHLKTLGRRSHLEVRSITQRHIVEPWPQVAALPANQVTPEQVADMMRRLIESGKGRTANKLRSYVRAAYQTAKAARTKPSIPVAFKLYGVTNNPAAETSPDETQNRSDKNPLGLEDMRTYWQHIQGMPGFKGAVLRLHLLTGGQRIEQLVQLKTANIEPNAITLHDGKGRPGKPPRPHALPLTPEAKDALAALNPQGLYAISTTDGEKHLAATTLSRWARDAASDAGLTDFTAKRIRSGVETFLASRGVSQETRGRLQSHGISGVQARHYDGHDYACEKTAALSALFDALCLSVGLNVVAIKAA
jgi:integrase